MMPSIGLIAVSGPRWLPPFPVPLFLLWPLVPLCFGIARLMNASRPDDAARLRIAMHAFCQLRGLIVDVETADNKSVRIRLV
jgi:hypothetical protein